jgi:hydrogenase expression/formation protein HypC
MCLSVPAEVISLLPDDGSLPRMRVRVGDAEKDIVSACTPDARPGDFVLIHVGFSIAVLDEAAARATLADLAQIRGGDDLATP